MSKCECCEKVKELQEYITDLEEECENLTEQNRLLTRALHEDDFEYRVCDVCGNIMDSGFVVGDEYYCSRECLEMKYEWDEYLKMYEEDEAYYTEWY